MTAAIPLQLPLRLSPKGESQNLPPCRDQREGGTEGGYPIRRLDRPRLSP